MSSTNDQEKKYLIKQSARQLFFQLGFSKTSMEDIARQSKLAKPTLYYYYPGKEAIFDEVVIEEAYLFMERVEQKVPDNVSADRKLAYFLGAVYEELTFYADKMIGLPETICEFSPHGRPIIEKLNALFQEKLLPLLQAGKKERCFDIVDEKMTASTLVFMTCFLNHDWIKHYPKEMRNKVVEETINIIVNGLKRRIE